MTRTRYATRAAFPGEVVEGFHIEPGVRVMINRPEAAPGKPVLVVVYALPNGNTIEQTVGKRLGPGDDWHFGIQQVGAQVRFVRAALADRAVAVAYLENDRKSWPAWRRLHGDAGIPAILDAVTSRFERPRTRLVLSGHSGGGSLIFGYLNAVDAVPDRVERIAFLDANYAYDTGAHLSKLTAWLRADGSHTLTVLAYNDAVARLDGKPFVTESGGTWGRSHRMVDDLEQSFPFVEERRDPIIRLSALGGRVGFRLHENPERKILHTIQVERNGVIEALLSGTPQEGVGYAYFGEPAYTRYVTAD
jgi:hypothetical protein